MRKTLFATFILCFFVFYFSDASAQCAMCKAVLESNQKDGGGIGAGLNTGILYLMAVPYIFLILGAAFWYYNKKYKADKNTV